MFRKVIKFSIITLLIIAILNIPVKTRQGFNYDINIFELPLYIKLSEFIDRDYHYRTLVNKIISGARAEEEKALAIFNWVTENIRAVPDGFDVIDDHVLNIIIRRYGTADQMCDVFTTLCVYSGIPAFRGIAGPDYNDMKISIAYVMLDRKWRVFDVYRKLFFRNRDGDIASVNDIISDIDIVREKGTLVKDVPYADFYSTLTPINKDFVSKEEKQAPLSRAIYEISRLFGRDKGNRYIKDSLSENENIR